MKVEVDSETVLASPFERLEDVLPANAFKHGFVGVGLDAPEANGEADPVQAGAGDLGEILFGLKEGVRVRLSEFEPIIGTRVGMGRELTMKVL